MRINHATQLLIICAAFLCLFGRGSSLLSDETHADTPRVDSNKANDGSANRTEFSAEDLEFFEKKVRPILVARCYECHQTKLAEPKGNLRLDSRQAILTGGDTGPAAEPGKLEESLLIDAIRYGDIYQMPPKSRLPEAELAILERWVKQGLPWPAEEQALARPASDKIFDLEKRQSKHWAWRPVQQPRVPEVAQTLWADSDIDRFILAKLEQHQLQPAAAASKSVLLRRVYFDLIGLPPTAKEFQAFLADESPTALSSVIDRLLASPQFGERWGRHWLDLVRYAESRGHEFDFTIPNVWQYRDYVIRAFNADVPYDQFVKEHIAGDLLPHPRFNPRQGFNESILGTGFWFLGEWVHSPVDIRKDETERQDNMIDVFSKTFLALTVGCARCHDHKFDAISQADYYALAGYLRSSHYRLARFETMRQNQQVARELAALNVEYTPLLAIQLMKAYEPVLQQLDQYLLQASEVARAFPASTTTELTAASELLGDTRAREQAAINQNSEKRQLKPTVLKAWVEVLRIALDEPDHPLHAFAIATKKLSSQETSAELLEQALAPVRRRWAARWKARQAALDGVRVMVDYSTINPAKFIPSSVAFGREPVPIGALVLGDSPQRPIQEIARYGAAKRPALWAGLKPVASAQRDGGRLGGWVRAGQTLYTPTFTLESGHLYYLVQGKGRIYATVNSHVTNNGPLHRQLLASFDTKIGSGPQWVKHDLSTYAGHTLHIEFSAEGPRDCSVLMVVEADQMPGSLQPSHQPLAQALATDIDSHATLARKYQQLFQASCKDIEESNFVLLVTEARLTANTKQRLKLIDRADLADWIVSQSSLFVSPDSEDYSRYQQFGAEYVRQRKEIINRIHPESQVAMTMLDGSGEDELLLIRGNSRTPGEPVPRRFLSALGGKPDSPSPVGSGRLRLAEQVVSPANPFISRVMVNRVWHHLLGRGLVASVDNFGELGTRPTHPELLDYLARDFMENGWSIKHLIREIMLTRTYQMASQHNTQADKQDPNNLLWHRAKVRRLEGEVLRDALLAVSGSLDTKQFGPSIPIHLTKFLQGRGRPASGPVDGKGRRSIYLSIRRNFLSPMMLAFDMPIPFTTMGKRNVSNVPAQALILMNDPLVVEQSRRWAERLLATKDTTPTERIQRMYQTAFARLPTSAELAAMKSFLHQQALELNLSSEQIMNHPQIWADLGHVLFNAKEFIYLR